MHKKFVVTIALFLGTCVLGWATPASAVKSKFEYEVPADKVDGGPAITVTFEHARPEDEGGDDIAKIGRVRSTVGIPNPVFAKKTDVAEVVPRFFKDALRNAGYDASVGEDADKPRLHVVLTGLWSDGYTHYTTVMEAKLEIYLPGQETPAWEGTIYGEGHVTVVMSTNEMKTAYAGMFADALARLIPMFTDESFRSVLR